MKEETSQLQSIFSPGKQKDTLSAVRLAPYLINLTKGKTVYTKKHSPFHVNTPYVSASSHTSMCAVYGMERIALDLYDNGTSSFNRIFATLPLFFTYAVGLNFI